jgi:transcriptional regulator with XRE-family HTH domain
VARIKQIQTDKKITQESVAYSANVERTYMNHVENGRRNVTLDTLERIVCEGLETSISEKMKKRTFIDLFAGCGGLSEGFLQSDK